MAVVQINPTRMELSRLNKKLYTARRGHKLLKDKRDDMMRRFLALATEAKALREKVENSLKKSGEQFAYASSVIGEKRAKAALMGFKKDMTVNVKYENITGVTVPEFEVKKSGKERLLPYGFYDTSYELDFAVWEMQSVFSDLLKLAHTEKACILLSAEIEKTRRRVNALENVLIPQYTESIRYIKMKLDENERSTRIRLLKVKDKIALEAINARKDRA